MTSALVSVVPTYQPKDDLIGLIGILRESGPVIVSDDASPCTSDQVLHSVSTLPSVTVIRHRHNRGIARGLNDGLRAAQRYRADWLLTVDQDSVLPTDYPAVALEILRSARERLPTIAALGAETINAGKGRINYPTTQVRGVATTPEVIQTGTLWAVDPLVDIGGFDESLGIDAIDAAACLRLRQSGYHVALGEGLSVNHRIGSSRSINVLGRTIMVTGHSPDRRASMLRNRLALFPAEFRQSPRHATRTIRRVAVNQSVGLILETDRFAKAMGTIHGLKKSNPDTLSS